MIIAKKYVGAWQTLNIIDRTLKKENKEYGITAVSFALERVKSYIQKLPAADVQEVKHGEWVRDEFDMLCCSECNLERFPYIFYFQHTSILPPFVCCEPFLPRSLQSCKHCGK